MSLVTGPRLITLLRGERGKVVLPHGAESAGLEAGREIPEGRLLDRLPVEVHEGRARGAGHDLVDHRIREEGERVPGE